jgi:dTMP kinase
VALASYCVSSRTAKVRKQMLWFRDAGQVMVDVGATHHARSAAAMVRTVQTIRGPAKYAGFFAVIDGPVGVGKTTVTAMAAAKLAAVGLSVLATRQPSDSPLGKLARFSTHDLHGLALTFLMAADRYHHYEHVIGPALAAGHIVLCDRYVTTALVLDQIDGAEPDFVWSIYRYLGWPDLAVVLTGDPAMCRARTQRRGLYSRFHEGGVTAAEAEASLYLSTAAMLAGYGYPIETVPIEDLSAEEVADNVAALIRDRMSSSRTA